MGKDAPPIDVSAVLDRAESNRTSVLIVTIAALIATLDGFDLQMIGLAAPAIAEEFGIPRAGLGIVFSAALGGLGVGAFLVGPLADVVGRKKVLVAAALWFGVFTLIGASATSATELLVLRFLAGVGMGGAMPSFISLVCEYLPPRRRSLAIGLVYAGVPAGGVLSSIVVPLLVGSHGWRWVFVVGGIVPIVVTIVVARFMPESLTFLVGKGAPTATVRRVLARVAPDVHTDADTRFVTGEVEAPRASVAELFRHGRGTGTVLIWVAFLVVFLMLATDTTWLPTLLAAVDFPLSGAAAALVAVNVGSLIGTSLGGWVYARTSISLALPIVMILATIGMAASGWLAPSWPGVVLAQGLLGFALGASSTGVLTLAANAYPTSVRSTGVGWAMGMGRVGSFVGPLAVGGLVAMQWTPAAVLGIVGALALVSAVCSALIGRRGSSVPPILTTPDTASTVFPT